LDEKSLQSYNSSNGKVFIYFQGINSGISPQPFILARHSTRFARKEAAKTFLHHSTEQEIGTMRKKDLVLWDKWEFILLAKADAFAASELKHFSCFNFPSEEKNILLPFSALFARLLCL
jgi:hypothetical protein